MLRQLAPFGGEAALGALFLLSIISIGTIGQRIWLFLRRFHNTDNFAKELLPLLRAADWRRAESLCQQTDASVCCVALAGLLESGNGLPAVRHALDTAISRERTALEDTFLVLNELGRLALLIGFVGSLFDLLAIGIANSAAAHSDSAGQAMTYSAIFPALAPAIGGLLVAIPAWLARSLLSVHVQRIVRECEFIARLVLSQLANAAPAAAGSSTPFIKTRRVAA
ncbi:MAG TPA: MotA/TolQ/ExbB proton channel family protein [Pirellulaceae bacterium]